MEKQLSPLEALEKIKDFIVELTNVKGIRHTECPNTELWVIRNFNLDIIETALKRQELLELDLRIANNNLKYAEKKLKALEIIKEKQVDCWALVRFDKNYRDLTDGDFGYISAIKLSQEEFDLLKEVLK